MFCGQSVSSHFSLELSESSPRTVIVASFFFTPTFFCVRIEMFLKVKFLRRWRSGQSHQTVNLTPTGYAGSNPALRTVR